MLEQWEADHLLRVPKVYSTSTAVTLVGGVVADYPIENVDGDEHFMFDVQCSRRNPTKVTFQLRYRRTVVLARMCTSVPHTNPDGRRISGPHYHLYREGYDDRWAEGVGPYSGLRDALADFCKRINLPEPDLGGGI